MLQIMKKDIRSIDLYSDIFQKILILYIMQE